MDSLFLGAILAISSTTIIVKALNDLKMKNERFAQLIFGVLIVEDIIDSGNTLSKVREILGLREPKSLAICTLLDKPSRREVEVPVEFIGFSIPDEFVVGYGIGICTGNDFFCHILSPFCSFLRFFQIIAKREPVHHGVLFSRRFVVFSRAARRGRSGQFRGFPIPLFSVDLPPVFRKFHSTIFCALRRMAALDSSERYTASTSPPSAST